MPGYETDRPASGGKPVSRRVIAAALVSLVLALPLVVAIWSVRESRDLGESAERAVTLTSAYERARYATTALSKGGVRGEIATRRIRAAMTVVKANGHQADRSLGYGIERSLGVYTGETEKLVSARERGDTRRVGRHHRNLERYALSMEERLRDAAATYRQTAFESMDESRRANYLGLFSLLALAALAPIMLQKRRRQGGDVVAESELRDLALTDNLTSLRNHRAFQEDFGRALAQRNRDGSVLSLVMVDLDGLKQVNDACGHQAGDQRIKALADCLRQTMREGDFAYRVGGDEFTVILPRERAWGAFEFAQRLRALAAAEGVGVAVGVTETTSHELKDAVMRRADMALIEAKRSHRNVVIYSDGLEPKRSASGVSASEHHSKTLATALALAADAKDGSTRNHCETVSELCVLIGTKLGLAEERLGKLRLAGLLHDVGKIGIADAILQKPGDLDPDETKIMRTHAEIGHNIINAAELHEEASFVLHHHERLDGHGYPYGLAGDEIPLESRIILVAHTFEAISSDRPYRDGRSQEDAFAELERYSGTQFDLACVEALRDALGIEVTPSEGATVTQLRPSVAV